MLIDHAANLEDLMPVVLAGHGGEGYYICYLSYLLLLLLILLSLLLATFVLRRPAITLYEVTERNTYEHHSKNISSW